MIGYKLNINKTKTRIYYEVTQDSLENLDRFLHHKGDLFICLEDIRFNNGFYRIFGYVTGQVPFNEYDFERCCPKGDVLILRYNTYGEPRNMDWDLFSEKYWREDSLDTFIIGDELPGFTNTISLSYSSEEQRRTEGSFEVEPIDYYNNIYNNPIDYTESWMLSSDDEI